jgi:medium-chain acyl-[acyl-carrier-protein] hydrolase
MSAWLQRFGSPTQPLARLFCFPHAGGVATFFRLWRERIPAQVELIAIQLPGRGGRLREPPIASVPALTECLLSELLPYLDRPYAFFGHSMGAVLAQELARAVAQAGRKEPAHLFLSARRPPHLPRPEAHLHPLPDDAFLKEIGIRYGGIPPEVLQERELLALLLPALRADITALETFNPLESEPLTCAITAFGGDEDHLVTLEQLRAWRRYTSGPFRVRQFRGGHFYLDRTRAELLVDVVQALTPLIATNCASRVAP